MSFVGPRGQASCPSQPLPASGPAPAACGRRAEPCPASPVTARRSTGLRAAEGVRRSLLGRCLALPGSRPLPGPPAATARAHVPARAAPRRAAPGCTASAAGGLGEGTGQGGSGGSWSAADRAPPAAGESAGRVSVGRETEAAAGARPPPPLEPPLSRPRALPGETRG